MRPIKSIVEIRKLIFPSIWNTKLDLTIICLVCMWVGFGTQWNGHSILMWGKTVPGYPVDRGESVGAVHLLRDVLSTYFFVVAYFFLRRVLLPLSKSFSLNQTLWLRMTPVRVGEIHLARILVAGEGLLLLVTPLMVVISLVWVKHHFPIIAILPMLASLWAYGVFGSGFTFFVAEIVDSEMPGSALAAVGGVLLPLLSYIFYETVLFNAGYHWARFYPTFFPFIPDLQLSNSLSLGIGGILLHIAGTFRYLR